MGSGSNYINLEVTDYYVLLYPEVTDYYVRMYDCVCALNTAENVAYPYARTVQLRYETCNFLGAVPSPREVRTEYEGTQAENCGFLC